VRYDALFIALMRSAIAAFIAEGLPVGKLAACSGSLLNRWTTTLAMPMQSRI
jgi:hypothetical protein